MNSFKKIALTSLAIGVAMKVVLSLSKNGESKLFANLLNADQLHSFNAPFKEIIADSICLEHLKL